MKLNEKIQLLRKQKGWTQEKLADELTVSRQALSKWELGTAIPDTQNILRLSKLFGVSTDYLLDEDYSMPEEMQQRERRQDKPAESKLTRKTKQLINDKGYVALYMLAGKQFVAVLGTAFICYGYISHLASFEPKWWTYPIQALYLPIAGAIGFVISLVMTIFYLVVAHKARRLVREK